MPWHDDKPMSPDEYIKSLKTLDFNHAKAGRFFDYTARQSYRYATGETPVSRPLAMAIRALILFSVRVPR